MAMNGGMVARNRGLCIPICSKIKVGQGMILSILMAGAVVSTAVAFPTNQTIALFAVVIFPFVLSFLMTRNIIDSLTIVWINEIFFGVSGTWIKIESIPGRGFLLLLVIVAYLFFNHIKINKEGNVKIKSIIVIFYGLLFPLFLLFYSVIVCGATIPNALNDVLRFGIIIMYFPIRDLCRRNFDIFFGWIIAATIILALFFVTMAVAPYSIRGPLLENWMISEHIIELFNISGDYTVRAAMTPMIFCFIGIFLGMMYALDSKQTFSAQLGGFILAIVTIIPFIVNFLRGSILGIGSAIIAIICLSSFDTTHLKKLIRIIIISVIIASLGYWISVNYIPMSLTKWVITGQDISEIVDPVRIEQTEKMIDAWLDEPILGKGVGMPISGYSRTNEAEGLAFEVQYPMVLYRVGVLGFIIIMVPFLWMIFRIILVWIKYYMILESYIGKFLMGVGFATMALLMASWTNPYFASSMTPFFIVLFVVLNDMARFHIKHSYLG